MQLREGTAFGKRCVSLRDFGQDILSAVSVKVK